MAPLVRRRSKIAAAALALALAVPGLARADMTPAQKQEVEAVVKAYLLEHPELLQEMMQKLDEQQKAAQADQRQSAIKQYAAAIFHDKADFVAGHADGDITMVEFFDYNCGWCKRGFPELMTLLDDDKKLKFVLKEFPIFGEDSEYAAKAALAAKNQGKYWQFHTTLFKTAGKVTKAGVDQTAKDLGLDMVKLKKDMESPAVAETLARNAALARSLAIEGTPAFVIGDRLIPGYLPHTEMAATIGEVRSAGGCTLC
jgi:protein-disulfide isomerase